jgi:hypothetical protein
MIYTGGVQEMLKKWLSLVLAVMMVIASLPAFAQTSDANPGSDGQQVVIDETADGSDSDGAVSDDNDDEAAVSNIDENKMQADGVADVENSSKAQITAPEKDNLGKFQKMRAEIQKLIKQRFFARANTLIDKVRAEVKSSRLTDERKKALMASLERRERATMHSVQGEYQKAANAIRSAISLNELKGDTDRLLKTQEKVSTQKEWFDIRANYEKDLTKLLEAKQPLLKEKLAVLRQLDSKRKLSKEEISKLQASLKQINERLAPLNKKIQETHRVFAVKRDKMRKEGIVLNSAQHRKLFPLVMKRMLVRFGNYNLHRQIARHLSNIAETNETSWEGLKENFARLQKLQEKVWDLRKQLDALAGKAPLSEEDYRKAKILRDQLEKAIAACEKALGKVEDAFIDQKVFGKLTDKEKAEFVKLFRDVWSRDKEFDSLKPSLEELYEKIFERPIIIDDPKPEPQPMPKPEPGKPSLEGEGYIIKEGNVFLLRFGDKILWPNNLPARYMVNKLEVKFGAEFILRAANQPTNELPQVDENGRPVDAWWKKYPEISFTYIHAPQLPDEPFKRDSDMATPTQVIEENLDNQNKPANLMNAF